MAARITDSVGAAPPPPAPHRIHEDPFTGRKEAISARAATARSLMTAIRADVGEAEVYKQALLRGEIGLQRPLGSNVAGVDFITAIRDQKSGLIVVLCTDVKSSERGKFPKPKTVPQKSWLAEVALAVDVGRLRLRQSVTDANGDGVPLLSKSELTQRENDIRAAVAAGRVRLRQLNADYSTAGQGKVTGW